MQKGRRRDLGAHARQRLTGFEPLQSHNDVSSMCDINNVTRPIALLAYCNVCLCVHCDILHHGMVVYQTTFDANKQQKKRRNMDIHRDTRA